MWVEVFSLDEKERGGGGGGGGEKVIIGEWWKDKYATEMGSQNPSTNSWLTITDLPWWYFIVSILSNCQCCKFANVFRNQ